MKNRLFPNSPLLTALTDSQWEKLNQGVVRLKLKPNDPLFMIGQTADRFYIVKHGKIKLFLTTKKNSEKI
ncbi:MAG: cyclic nucleotide-binding domain-containing protein, partial [Magnetococcales bacterium]|nr:cyclic nucleotide-binding domain-containing protein [Magnetococcales bacterium]